MAAIMRAAGVTEIRIPDEWLVRLPVGSVLRYHDDRIDMTVFRLVTPGDVIDGEEVPMPVYVAHLAPPAISGRP